MAVHPAESVPPGAIDADGTAGTAPPSLEPISQAAIEIVGRVVAGANPAAPATDEAPDETETVHALQLAALDNLIDVVNLRERLAERESRVAELEAQVADLESAVDTWRQRAFNESCAREADSALAYDRQRELITVLHRQLIENDDLQAELAWRSLRWWRRVGRRGPTPVRAPASAAR